MRAGKDEEGETGAGAGLSYRTQLPIQAVRPASPVQHATPWAEDRGDEALMVAYREGDTGAFRLLYTRHRGGLYRYLLRQCGTAAIAEELFQDVWFSVIRARHRYAPDARFATYLYRIAHNRLIDHFRRSNHRPSTQAGEELDDALATLAADPRHEPTTQLETKGRLERFMRLLESLPDAQREAFILHEEAGLNVEEIGAATGVNAETAKSRLRYALAKLRRGLQEWL